MKPDVHPLISIFQQRAQLLDAQGSTLGLDDAVWKLAAWASLAQGRLTEDDLALLGEIGGILYHEGLARRLPGGDQ